MKKGIVSILMLVLWGFCICIGFWLGHKFTAAMDQKFKNVSDGIAGRKALRKAEQELAAGAGPLFQDQLEPAMEEAR